LQHATSNFADEERLGQGSYGIVYKGRLEVEGIERHVAIKRIIDTVSDQSRKYFANEISIMRRVNHRNIIHLVGLCEEGDNLLLVYELMENGNLENKLYPRNGAMDLEVYSQMDPATTPLLLDWHKRYWSYLNKHMFSFPFLLLP
jgi:serine/threonine protein kinase